MVKKYYYSAFVIFLSINFNIAFASLEDDSNTIFNWAERQYPQIFKTKETTQTFGVWFYRYYSSTGVYVGVNDLSQVHVMGGQFGDSPLLVGTTSEFLTTINAAGSSGHIINSGNGNCVATKFTPTGTIAVYESIPASPPNPEKKQITDTFLESTANKMTIKTEEIYEGQQSGFTVKGTSVGVGTIYLKMVDGIVYNTKTEISNTNTANVIDASGNLVTEEPTVIKFDAVTTYSPSSFSTPGNQLCEQQSWYSAPVEQNQTGTQITDGVSSDISLLGGSTVGLTSVVEAINESITVPAGTFTTLRKRTKRDTRPAGTYSVVWISTEHHVTVKRENYFNNILKNGKQLISLSQ
jgi:hypothetical protein